MHSRDVWAYAVMPAQRMCLFLSFISIFIQKPKSELNPFKKSWRLQNSKVLMALCSTSVMTKTIASKLMHKHSYEVF